MFLQVCYVTDNLDSPLYVHFLVENHLKGEKKVFVFFFSGGGERVTNMLTCYSSSIRDVL